MGSEDPNESTASVVKELKKQSSGGTNIIKEYKDIFSKEKSSGSDLEHDKIADEGDAALDLLKTLIEEKTESIAKEDKRKKWDFATSPHEHFGKTLDDTFGAFLAWAKCKADESQVNVSKALRRLESYADWMHETGTDLIEPALTSASVQKCVEAWAFTTSIDSEGHLVWWGDMSKVTDDYKQFKKDYAPQDHLRAFVWYCHAIMYNENAQRNGLIWVYNLAKMGMMDMFTLMPSELGTKLDRLTIGVLPIKMKCMYMFESPTWVNVFMKIIGVFMSKKMKERMVFLKDWNQTEKLGGLEAIPKGFGKVDGTYEGSVVDKYFEES